MKDLLTILRAFFARYSTATWCTVFALAVVLPLLSNSYVLRTFTIFYVYLLLACGLAIVVSYAGLLDLGYIAFFAVGAYLYAVLSQATQLSFWLILPLGAILAASVGVLLGFPTLRVRGDYLAIVTLGFGEIVHVLLVNIWGPHGIVGIRPPIPLEVMGGPRQLYITFYYIALAAVPLVFLILKQVIRSPLSRAWYSIRDNERAARSCGINSVPWLLLAFAIGTAIAGFSGVVFVGIQRYVNPASFVLEESIFVLTIVVLAGPGSIWRLVLAAAVLSLFPELMRGLSDYRAFAFGWLLVLIVLIEEKFTRSFFPQINNPSQPRNIAPQCPDKQDTAPVPQFLLKKQKDDWLLESRDVSVTFGGVKAIDRLTVNVNLCGQIVGLIGPNGAGKTTWFNCICGEILPDEGHILYPGAKRKFRAHNSARLGIARTFQIPQLFDSMDICDNLGVGQFAKKGMPIINSLYSGRLWRTFSNEESQRVDEILKFLDLDNTEKTNVTELPLGLQRRVEIGRALIQCPRVVLLDEVASGMSTAEKRGIAQLIRQLASDAHIGFIVVEHDLDFVLELAQRILVMDAGRLIYDGPPEQVSGNEAVIRAYIGNPHELA